MKESRRGNRHYLLWTLDKSEDYPSSCSYNIDRQGLRSRSTVYVVTSTTERNCDVDDQDRR